ncbi:MAG TPA: NAD(P)/FAD-dependent oxidoreductase, partial [Chitinophagales bacterium]|nr:NAD(P)/FAD-dependent oxidoreductase [Chitinophagales bacterium]HNM09214.1 NAD(P)/FAD-dependent oxidoreductase [Chitinophagales bacterium]
MTYRYSDNSLPMVLIIGAGFAGLELIKQFNNKPFRVLLLDKNNYHTFQPLLYQIASAGLTAESIAYPVRRKIGAYPNIAFRVAEVSSVDTSGQLVHTDIGEFHYDYLIIASGASTNFYGNNSLASTTFPLKSVQDALNMRTTILQQFEKAVNASKTNGSKLLNFIIVGGGPTGVELAGALAEIKKNVVPSDYRELDPEMMEVHLIEAAPRVLGTMSEKSSRLAKKYLEQLGVKVWLNAVVNSYENDILTLSNDTKITAHHVIWTAGVKGVDIKGLEGNIRTRGNRIITDRYHRISGFENIYAIGDIASIQGDEQYPQGHPGVAQVAIQQAHNLASN